MAQDNIPKSVKDRIQEWGKKSKNMSNNPKKYKTGCSSKTYF